MCDTPSHGSDHLWLIWKESIQNCRCYRADTAGGTDGRTDGQTDGRTDGRTEWNQYTPQQLRCSGGIISRRILTCMPVGQMHFVYLKRGTSNFVNAKEICSPQSAFNLIINPRIKLIWLDTSGHIRFRCRFLIYSADRDVNLIFPRRYKDWLTFGKAPGLLLTESISYILFCYFNFADMN